MLSLFLSNKWKFHTKGVLSSADKRSKQGVGGSVKCWHRWQKDEGGSRVWTPDPPNMADITCEQLLTPHFNKVVKDRPIFIHIEYHVSSFIWPCKSLSEALFNRPGVAGAVLQTPLSPTDSITHDLWKYLQYTFTLKPKELGAQIVREGSPPPTCLVSRVMHHMSCVTCHMSCVICTVSRVTWRRK